MLCVSIIHSLRRATSRCTHGVYIANVRDALLQPRPLALLVGAVAAHPHPLSSAIRHYLSKKTKIGCPFAYLLYELRQSHQQVLQGTWLHFKV